MTALHQLGRVLEEIGEPEHALAAHKDGDHYAEMLKHAKTIMRDAQRLQQRGDRHLRSISKRMQGANDAG